MKRHTIILSLLLSLASICSQTHAQSTAWSYQGYLLEQDQGATGAFDMTFALFASDTGGDAVVTVTNTMVVVSNGLFATSLDFGATVFDGTEYWLEIQVASPGSLSLTTLSPRQRVASVPQALYAHYAMDLVNPVFLGTTMDAPLELYANSTRGLQLAVSSDGHSANLLMGASANSIENGVRGATVSGGGESGPSAWSPNPLPNVVSASYAVIGGGLGNTNGGNRAVINGGLQNSIEAGGTGSVICGGEGNVIRLGASAATIAGGVGNELGSSAFESFIGGGRNNSISPDGFWGVIGGGADNHIGSFQSHSVIGGGFRNDIGDFSLYSNIAGGRGNSISMASRASISGGEDNRIGSQANGATIGGGLDNSVRQNGAFATIGGGSQNTISNSYSTVSGGGYNRALGYGATVGGGGGLSDDEEPAPNKAEGRWSTVSGGVLNAAIGDQSNVAGGSYNVARGESACIPGGYGNAAEGDFSFAAGWNAQANHDGSFVWADNSPFGLASTTNREFAVRATGGVRFVTGIDTNGAATAGVSVSAGGTGWDVISDRDMKENVVPVDGKAVLDQVVAMPVSRWNMKSQDPSVRHIGPMAQDFHAAFGLGSSDKRINTVDADGVALAAIQGLHTMVTEKDRQIRDMQATIIALTRRLEALERRAGE